jgi:tRNA1Val (adenine37-N6)-methyltransferase
MANPFFQFKQFTVHQDKCAMKVTTDACLFGAWAANEVKSLKSEVRNVLDIGTGTGLLSLMLAQKNPAAVIDAFEIDEVAAAQAEKNVADSPWSGRIQIIRADAKVYEYNRQYDIIISNPPFYERELKGSNRLRNLAHHNEGLLLPDLLHIIKKGLKAGGNFFLLLPYKRNAEIKNMLTRQEFPVIRIILIKPSVNNDYFRIAISGTKESRHESETIIEEISIKDEDDRYTPEFISLLKDYYLYL